MPNVKSAKKRVLVTATKNMQNKMLVSNLKTVIKKAELAIANDDENKEEAVRYAVKKIDQASAKGLLHKNNAARKKSALASKIVG
jgi:small subunit ribosomal protein S20